MKNKGIPKIHWPFLAFPKSTTISVYTDIKPVHRLLSIQDNAIENPAIAVKGKTMRKVRAGLLLAVWALCAVWSPAVAGETWAVYFYLCGSDLETKFGSASKDLVEAMQVDFPEGVEFIVQTGGANKWELNALGSDAMYRLRRAGEGYDILEKIPNANMGDPRTLTSFLKFCEENFPADRKMLILWDHGGGSAGGICYDELYGDDALSYYELKTALTAAYGPEPKSKPLEIIGFDACLMATVDTAGVCAPFANYMVASQETEPSCGWEYQGFFSELVKNPAMDGAELGRIICDTYLQGCKDISRDKNATLSVVDLAKTERLAMMLSLISYEGIASLGENPSTFYAKMGRSAKRADVYGSGMMDLGSMVQANADIFSVFGDRLLQALRESVVYKVGGRFRAKSNGISVFYPTPKEVEEYDTYGKSAQAGGMKSFYYLFEPLIRGKLSDEATSFMTALPYYAKSFEEMEAEQGTPEDLSLSEVPEVTRESLESASNFTDTSDMGFDDHPVRITVDDDNTTRTQIAIDPEKMEFLESVTFLLGICDDDGNVEITLGEDSDVGGDWEAGVFIDAFRGVWGSLNGYIVSLKVASITDDYVLYNVPIKMDGQRYDLKVAYSFTDKEYQLLAAQLSDSETGGVPSRQDRLLVKGDTITTVFIQLDEEGGYTYQEHATFTLEDTPVFYEVDLDDGRYGFVFQLTDAQGNSYLSEMSYVDIKDGVSHVVSMEDAYCDQPKEEEEAEEEEEANLDLHQVLLGREGYIGVADDGMMTAALSGSDRLADAEPDGRMYLIALSEDESEGILIGGVPSLDDDGVLKIQNEKYDTSLSVRMVEFDGEELVVELFDGVFRMRPMDADELLRFTRTVVNAESTTNTESGAGFEEKEEEEETPTPTAEAEEEVDFHESMNVVQILESRPGFLGYGGGGIIIMAANYDPPMGTSRCMYVAVLDGEAKPLIEINGPLMCDEHDNIHVVDVTTARTAVLETRAVSRDLISLSFMDVDFTLEAIETQERLEEIMSEIVR